MNLDICKNCLKKLNHFRILELARNYCVLEGFDSEKNVICQVKSTNPLTRRKMLAVKQFELMEGKTRLIPVKAIIEDETFLPDYEVCPYHLEHQLSKWNKKNE